MKTGRLSLGVLCLSGCLILSTCLLHKYHFVNMNLNWYQAQTYCKNNYIDLATIESSAEVNKLINTVSSAGYNSEVWIGIYVTLLGSWTYDYASSYLMWETQPGRNTFFHKAWCGSIEASGMSWYENCTTEHPFICDNGNQKVFINVSMDYLDAWKYCKENFTDLTAPFNSSMNVWSSEFPLDPSEGRVWFGLIGFDYYFWSDLSTVSFKYWDALPPLFNTVVLHGAADLQQSGKWSFLTSGSLPFVCYTEDIQVDIIKVLQLRVSSSAVSDSVLQANILTQLQNIFMEKGMSGVTLKWRKQADGKIFLVKGNTDVLDEDGCLLNI